MTGTRRSTRTTGRVRTVTRTVNITGYTRFLWKAVIACIVIALFIGAICYNHFHISAEERAITNYMNAQQMNVETDSLNDTSDMDKDESVPAEEENTEAEVDQDAKNSEASFYLMPDSAVRYLTSSEIEIYSQDEIQLIINEIYARHGCEFHLQDNIDYFSTQDWYEPISGKSNEEIEREFNEFEKANVRLLCEYR